MTLNIPRPGQLYPSASRRRASTVPPSGGSLDQRRAALSRAMSRPHRPKITDWATRKSGFTLLELLVAVAIFSGLMIVVLGSFSRSAFSLAGVDSLRQKSQAARGLIDAISNDWQFLYLQDPDPLRPVAFEDPGAGAANQYKLYRGFSLSGDGTRLLLLLKYPGQLSTDLVRRLYRLEEKNGRSTLSVVEDRQCQIKQEVIECPNPAVPASDLLPTTLGIDLVSGPTARSQFSGKLVLDALAQPLPALPETGYLHIRLTVKSTDLLPPVQPNEIGCEVAPPGACYTVSTTLNAGVIR